MEDIIEIEEGAEYVSNPTKHPHLRLIHGGSGNPPVGHNWLARVPPGTIFLARPTSLKYVENLMPYEVKHHFRKCSLLRLSHPDEREMYLYVDQTRFSGMNDMVEIIYPRTKEQENEDQGNWPDRSGDLEHDDHVET